MADTPQSVSLQNLAVEIRIEGQEISSLFVTNIHVDRQVNKMPRAKISIVDGDASLQDFEQSNKDIFTPGKSLEIRAGYGSTLDVIFKGIIIKQQVRLNSTGQSSLILYGGDKALKLSVARKSEYFEASTDRDIISKVLENMTGDIASTSTSYPLIIQNNATDWDFIMSRVDINGLVAVVNDGKVDVVKPAIDQPPTLTVTFGESLIDFDLILDAQFQLKDVSAQAWDYKNMEVINNNSTEPVTSRQGNIDGETLSKVLDVSDYTLTTTAALSSDALKIWADAQLVKSRLSRIRGRVSFRGNAKAVPNSVIEIKGISNRFNGNSFVSGVIHSISEGLWQTEAIIGLSSTWFVEEYPNVSQSPAAGLLPGIQGLQNGTVKNLETDPDGQLRLLVDIPVLDTEGVGVWARLATFYASANVGAYFIPEVGDEVILGFLNDDPNFPIILGAMYNGDQQAPPFDFTEANNQKGIVTRSQLKLAFDEEKKSVSIETPNGNKITLDDDGQLLKLEDENGNKITMDKNGVTITSAKDIKLDAKSGKIEISSGQKTEISSDGDISLTAQKNITNKANANFEAEGTAGSKLKSSAKVDVNGSAMVVINGGLVKIN